MRNVTTRPTVFNRRAAKVGSYATLDGAARAVAHLVRRDHDEHHVLIAPCEHRPVRERVRDRLVRGARTGALIGLVVLSLFSIVRTTGFDRFLASIAGPVVIGTAIAAFIGAVVELLRQRLERARELDSPREIVATRFDIVSTVERAEEADRDLAQWWDPAAPPAPYRRAA